MHSFQQLNHRQAWLVDMLVDELQQHEAPQHGNEFQLPGKLSELSSCGLCRL
jgi:hypothetical protein